MLNSHAWIGTDENGFKTPSELRKKDVVKEFGIAENAPVLGYLQFMPEAIDKLLGQLRLTVKNEIEDEDERHAVLTAAVEMSCREIRENLVRYREKGELSYDTADA